MRPKLPWQAWVVALVSVPVAMIVAIIISVLIGLNPYIGASLGGCGAALIMTYYVGLWEKARLQ